MRLGRQRTLRDVPRSRTQFEQRPLRQLERMRLVEARRLPPGSAGADSLGCSASELAVVMRHLGRDSANAMAIPIRTNTYANFSRLFQIGTSYATA